MRTCKKGKRATDKTEEPLNEKDFSRFLCISVCIQQRIENICQTARWGYWSSHLTQGYFCLHKLNLICGQRVSISSRANTRRRSTFDANNFQSISSSLCFFFFLVFFLSSGTLLDKSACSTFCLCWLMFSRLNSGFQNLSTAHTCNPWIFLKAKIDLCAFWNLNLSSPPSQKSETSGEHF